MDEKFFDGMLGTIVMFDKAYKTFKSQNPREDKETILALTDIWWRGLMTSIAESNHRDSDDIGGIDGFGN